MSAEPASLPPVRLQPEAQLARDALASPLLARAVRIARWAGPETRVGAGGELVDEQLPAAAAHLGFAEDDEDGPANASEAWRVAVDIGLVDVTDGEEGAGEDGQDSDGTVTAGEDLAAVTSGSPEDVLGLWLGALDTVFADATAPDLEDILGAIEDGGDIDLGQLDWDPQAEADFLEGILGNLYLLTVGEGATGESPTDAVPLPALAASMIVPEDMGEPTDDVLEQVSDAMMRLDDQFRMLEPTGLVEFRPVDEELMAEAGDDPDPLDGDDEDISRYGMVRLTPLGLYGVRARMLEAGVDAPAVGDLADKGADTLLAATAEFPPEAARAETELWLSGRDPLTAARELLSAAHGDDEAAPLRRLLCQQALSLTGSAAEPALREVLDDGRLGGLARVWLAEHGASDVPPPPEEMVYWLTVDTVAAQLQAEGNSEELQGLVEGLAEQHSGFFDIAWRVDHPATADVLEAMGRLHPDKKVAKEARKAAFKARSHGGR
ncbi:hypothetical protein DSC45_11380 [Streptomyces sp. YIM 130001]|uniref:hypothetical protein n=1 Tax=Streptomyces sp. YIM 130001 TaxID=2259644 RepID=UPI000E65DA7B|nr:hypothetical protein [Streptomyces sp. YIM 130001]RII18511.1 hypothetical protein DSC45_11380 [Streptomyces sp. YIM 130001]